MAAVPGLDMMIDADHIVRGEGISWMRQYLGEDASAPIRHPHIVSGFGLRVMGLSIPNFKDSAAATIIPSVGCPMGCNFCTTSAFFGGKGKFLDFYSTGRELFDVMCEMESSLHARSFFIMDENFLLNRERAIELLGYMKKESKPWAFYVFSSANAIQRYSMEELVQLGISWIWMGLESPNCSYTKLKGTDTVKLTRELRGHGIKLLGSTIVGLEHHTPENIAAEIEYAVSHNTDFHQFMLYTPVPGTPLHAEMVEQNRMLTEVDLADIHGQFKFNFKHAAISRDDSKKFLDSAFQLDFDTNGPEPLSHLAHYARRMEALQEPPRPPRARSVPVGDPAVDDRCQRLPVGHGAPLQEVERGPERQDPDAADRHRGGVRPADANCRGAGRTTRAVDPSQGNETPGPRQDLRAAPPLSNAATGSKPNPDLPRHQPAQVPTADYTGLVLVPAGPGPVGLQADRAWVAIGKQSGNLAFPVHPTRPQRQPMRLAVRETAVLGVYVRDAPGRQQAITLGKRILSRHVGVGRIPDRLQIRV